MPRLKPVATTSKPWRGRDLRLMTATFFSPLEMQCRAVLDSESTKKNGGFHGLDNLRQVTSKGAAPARLHTLCVCRSACLRVCVSVVVVLRGCVSVVLRACVSVVLRVCASSCCVSASLLLCIYCDYAFARAHWIGPTHRVSYCLIAMQRCVTHGRAYLPHPATPCAPIPAPIPVTPPLPYHTYRTTSTIPHLPQPATPRAPIPATSPLPYHTCHTTSTIPHLSQQVGGSVIIDSCFNIASLAGLGKLEEIGGTLYTRDTHLVQCSVCRQFCKQFCKRCWSCRLGVW